MLKNTWVKKLSLKLIALLAISLLSACSSAPESLYSPNYTGGTGLVAITPTQSQTGGGPKVQGQPNSFQLIQRLDSIDVTLASLRSDIASQGEEIAAVRESLSAYVKLPALNAIQAKNIAQLDAIEALNKTIETLQRDFELDKRHRAAEAEQPIGPFSSDGSGTDEALSFGLHLASYEKSNQVRTGWLKLNSEHGDNLKGLTPYVVTIEIDKLGTFYRLLLGPLANRKAAEDKCALLKAVGQFCKAVQLTGERLV